MRNITKLSLLLGGLAASTLSMAQDVGRVISSTPVMQQVGVPQRVCQTQQVVVQEPNSGAGAVIGMIAGAALGQASGGRRSDRAAASAIGAFGGALLGNAIEGNREPELRDVQRCGTQTSYENRVVGYNVVYEFGGRQYNVQMPQDPGPTIQLRVTPVGATTPAAQPVYSTVQPAAVVYQQPVVVSEPVYPVYYTRPYAPPVSVNLTYSVGGGWGRHGYYYGPRRW